MSEETSNENPEQDPTKDSQVSEINEKSNSEPTGPEAEMAELKTQLEKAQNDYLYLRAEFENYKKQMIKERSDYLKYGSERLVVGFLDVLDNFDRALTIDLDPAKPENIESYKQGMEMTAKEFKSTLKKFSVEEVECKGQPFDPNLHEALGAEETDQIPAGHISQVFKAAYKLHERVIRPAQVIVAKEKG